MINKCNDCKHNQSEYTSANGISRCNDCMEKLVSKYISKRPVTKSDIAFAKSAILQSENFTD